MSGYPSPKPAHAQHEQQGVSSAGSQYTTPRSGMSTPPHDLEEPGTIEQYSSASTAPLSVTSPSEAPQAQAAGSNAAAAAGPGSQDAAADAQAARLDSYQSTALPDSPGAHEPTPTAPMDAAAEDTASASTSSSPSKHTLQPSSMHASQLTAGMSSSDATPPDSPSSSSAARSADSLPPAAAMASMHLVEQSTPSSPESTAEAAASSTPAGGAALTAAETVALGATGVPGRTTELAGDSTSRHTASEEPASAADSAPYAGHMRHVSALSFGSLASDSALDSLGPPSSGASDAAAEEDAAAPSAPGTPTAHAAAAKEGAASVSSASTSGAAAAAGAAAVEGASNSSMNGAVMPGPSSAFGGPEAGEAGSSSSEIGLEAGIATQEVQLDVRRLSSTSPSTDPEAAAWEAWQAHKRHFFVVTSAGKPVFSRHGDETALAGFMAIIQAIVSVVADQGDTIRSMQAGAHQLVFLLRGHLYLVAVSSAGEPKVALVRQLEMLYHQMLVIVTTSVERMLQRNPGYDVAQLLAGTTNIHKDLLRSFSRCPGYLLDTYEPAPMAAADRRMATESLQEAVRASGALYGLLVSGRRLMALDCARSPPLHPSDILLTINFVSASESFRRAGESFSPLCLPHFKASAFLHAYIACLDPNLGAFLLLLSGSSDAFFALSAARGALEMRLRDAGVVQRLVDIAGQPGGGRQRVDALPKPAGGPFGTTPLWHYCIRFPARKQLLMSAYSEAFQQPSQQKAIIRAYARLHCSAYALVHSSSSSVGGSSSTGAGLHGRGLGSSSASSSKSGGGSSSSVGGGSSSGGAPGSASAAAAAAAAAAAYMLPGSAPRPARLVWVTGRHWVAICCSDKEVELYAIMDPLTDKKLGSAVCEQLQRHYGDKARQQELLLPS